MYDIKKNVSILNEKLQICTFSTYVRSIDNFLL